MLIDCNHRLQIFENGVRPSRLQAHVDMTYLYPDLCGMPVSLRHKGAIDQNLAAGTRAVFVGGSAMSLAA